MAPPVGFADACRVLDIMCEPPTRGQVRGKHATVRAPPLLLLPASYATRWVTGRGRGRAPHLPLTLACSRSLLPRSLAALWSLAIGAAIAMRRSSRPSHGCALFPSQSRTTIISSSGRPPSVPLSQLSSTPQRRRSRSMAATRARRRAAVSRG
jgi:hypothetical protein